ncbi:MAG: PP2C family protein-serine/threonine phosphatase [Phycisphaerales bacterium JB040]
MTEPHQHHEPKTLTVCCGLTLRGPVERWIGPVLRCWPGRSPSVRLTTVPMLQHEQADDNQASLSAMLAIVPSDEPRTQTYSILEHARRTNRPTLILCERLDDRLRAVNEEGILVEHWDTPPEEVVSMLTTLEKRQPTVTRLSRELDIAERLVTRAMEAPSSGEELHLAGLLPDELIPKTPPRIMGLELGVAHRAAGVIPRDLIDVALVDEDVVRIFMADGLSEGTAGALLCMRLIRALRAMGRESGLTSVFHPSQALSVLNEQLCEFQVTGAGHRAAAVYALLDLRSAELTLASAGAPLPTIATPEGVRRFGISGSPLGTREGAEFRETTTTLDEHGVLAFLSDGAEQAFRDAADHDLMHELQAVSGSEGSLGEECARLERLCDAMPGSLHRSNDATILTMRLSESKRYNRDAA